MKIGKAEAESEAEETKMFQYLLHKPINYSHLLNIMTHALKEWDLYCEYGYNAPMIVHKESNKTFSKNDSSFKGLRVLLVDDEYFSRNALMRLLQKKELDVSAYADGNEALEKFITTEYDLAIFDYQMPYMDGITLTTKVREYEIASNNRSMAIIRNVYRVVIVLTGDSSSELLESAKRVGIDAVCNILLIVSNKTT